MEKLLITSYFSFSHNDFKRQKATYVFFYSPEYSSSGNGPSAQKKLKVDGSINNTKTLTELALVPRPLLLLSHCHALREKP